MPKLTEAQAIIIAAFITGIFGLIAAVIVVGMGNEDESEPTNQPFISSVANAPSNTPSINASSTNTLEPSATPTDSITSTPRPTRTPRPTNTATLQPTEIPQSAILYQEDFEDGFADGLLHENWSENRFEVINDGTGNQVLSGTNKIASYFYVEGSKTWENYSLTLRFRIDDQFSSNSLVEILVRRKSACQAYDLFLTRFWHKINLLYGSDCDKTVLATGSNYPIGWDFLPNVWHTLNMEANQSLITWQLDGGPIYEAIDDTYSKGGIGFDLWEVTGNLWIDDIVVWSLDESQ